MNMYSEAKMICQIKELVLSYIIFFPFRVIFYSFFLNIKQILRKFGENAFVFQENFLLFLFAVAD